MADIELLKRINSTLQEAEKKKRLQQIRAQDLKEEERKDEEATKLAMSMAMNEALMEELRNVRAEIAKGANISVQAPEVNVPEIKIPKIKVPAAKVPEIKVPDITVPEIKLPKINVPKPEVTVNVPDIKIPEINIPETVFPSEMDVTIRGVSPKTPLHVMPVDAAGKLLNPGSSGGGNFGKTNSYLKEIVENHEVSLNTKGIGDSMFRDVLTTERQNVIELKSNVNKESVLRNVISVTGASSTVTSNSSEYTLSLPASGSRSATLDSAERGRYQPGFGAECGIAVRYPSTPTGEQQAKWGYFNDDDGFYFGEDATGVFVAILRNGTETKTYQSSWNTDKLDGSGSSGLTLDTADGNIYQIRFSWYGYGSAEFVVVTSNDEGKQQSIVVHRFNPTSETSILEPNLPIRAYIENGATSSTQSLNVAGRQFSILGKVNPIRRITSDYRILQGSIATTFVPTISARRESTSLGTSVKVEAFDIITDANILVQVRLNGSLTNPTWGTPADHSSLETVCEFDKSASAITGGEVIWEGLVESGGVGSNSSGSISIPIINQDFVDSQPITICVRALSGTGVTVSTVLRVLEEW